MSAFREVPGLEMQQTLPVELVRPRPEKVTNKDVLPVQSDALAPRVDGREVRSWCSGNAERDVGLQTGGFCEVKALWRDRCCCIVFRCCQQCHPRIKPCSGHAVLRERLRDEEALLSSGSVNLL